MKFISHQGDDCHTFFKNYLTADRRGLLIGTLGFNDLCLHFPTVLASFGNVDFLFLVEDRPEVSEVLRQAAERNRGVLLQRLTGRKVVFQTVAIVADDTANVAGRRAAAVCLKPMGNGYTDIFVDASSMSRGVCFPIAKQAHELAKRTGGAHAHVLVAGRNTSAIQAQGMSSDAPQYIHGFQADMGTEDVRTAIKLWIPQLSEGYVVSLSRIQRVLRPEESCPLLPFPSSDPRRSDQLLKEFQEPLLNDWDVNLRDIIYAHETDPMDVCETITRIHCSRDDAFRAATTREARTVLSPAGTRIGSVGMLLAALRLDLPIMYEESIGYTSDHVAIPPISEAPPENVWHIWLSPFSPT